jgi:hypothetical protein
MMTSVPGGTEKGGDGLPQDPATLVARMVDGTLGFPYKSAYLRPPEEYFSNLRRFNYVTVSDSPYIARMRGARGRGSVRKAIARTPWGFDRREISLVVGDGAFEDVDQLTDHFTEEARMAANIRGSPAPLAAWRDPDIAAAIAERAVSTCRRAGGLTLYDLREACYEKVPECTLFKISLAKEIYRFFDAKTVLDPFGGWGDRGLGAAGAGVARYVGVDPNPALVEGYARIVDFVGREAPDVKISYRSLPIEAYGPAEYAADFPDGPPTLAFSSPPFHDYEIYSDDPRQSVSAGRNATLAGWLCGWFFPALDRVWGALAPRGHLALYLTDERGEVTTPLCDYMAEKGRHFRGVVACRRGTKRPLPLWVWRKGAHEEVAVPAPDPAGPPATQSMDDYVAALLEEIYAGMG